MGGRECCVNFCESSSHDPQGRMLLNGLSFHCFPAWRTKEGSLISELTRRRRAAWVAAVGRPDITFDRIPSSMRVCSKHFISGKPAYEMLDKDPDWVPSLLMRRKVEDEGNSKKKIRKQVLKKKSTKRANSATAVRKPPPPPWRAVRSTLLSLLEIKAAGAQAPPVSAQNQAAEKRADTSFRDFFRNALETSLEASIQARARSKSRPSSTEYEVQLNFKLPSPEGEPGTKKGSSSCRSCSKKLRRIKELEQQLFKLSSRQKQRGRDEASAAGSRPDRDSLEEKEEEIYELTGHIKPVDSEGEPDPETAPFSSDPSSPASDSPPSTSRRPSAARRPLRFRKQWLAEFPFLRFSPSLNVMWCHVCRIHSGPFPGNHQLIKGSKNFTRYSIVKHSNCVYHKQNMERSRWSSTQTDSPLVWVLGPGHSQ